MIDLSEGTAEPIGDLDGVQYVSTPGHGYLTFSEQAASNLLTSAALKHSELSSDGRLCFEHDVAILIPLLDSPEVFDAYSPNLTSDKAYKVRKEALEAISGFYPEYLEAQGIAAPKEGRTIAEERALNDKLREDKSPDLIVTAFGSFGSLQPDTCLVHTADGKRHLIDQKSYNQDINHRVPLLSQCKGVIALEDAPSAGERFAKHLPELFIRTMKSKAPDDSVEGLADTLKDQRDNLITALVREQEYFQAGDTPRSETLREADSLMLRALHSPGWDRPDAGPMISLETRKSVFDHDKAKLRSQIKASLDKKIHPESSGPSGL